MASLRCRAGHSCHRRHTTPQMRERGVGDGMLVSRLSDAGFGRCSLSLSINTGGFCLARRPSSVTAAEDAYFNHRPGLGSTAGEGRTTSMHTLLKCLLSLFLSHPHTHTPFLFRYPSLHNRSNDKFVRGKHQHVVLSRNSAAPTKSPGASRRTAIVCLRMSVTQECQPSVSHRPAAERRAPRGFRHSLDRRR
ncbi:hypothetical protein LY76DRAFT_288196 [Colletotrichum caudatum]|nr:hypothetical protein LY76DRAFT_288196 [Colletotrichum caudatum]